MPVVLNWTSYLVDFLVLALGAGAAISAFVIGWKMTAPQKPAAPSRTEKAETFEYRASGPYLSVISSILHEGLNGLHVVLSLQNTGSPALFEQFEAAPGQFVRMIPQLANRSPLKAGMVLGAGERIRIVVEGGSIANQPYQFALHFSDLAGNTYRQEITGIGDDPPMVDRIYHL